MGRKLNNIIGNKYGNLTVIKKSHYKKKNLYWECKCECGEICYATSSDLKRGRKNFCNNCNREKSKKSVLNILYNNYKRGAIKRGFDFELNINEFEKIIHSNCYYCGIEPKQILNKKGMREQLIYNGIDRINNDFGYTINNSVPCCKFCNFAKKGFNINEFKEWLIIIKSIK